MKVAEYTIACLRHLREAVGYVQMIWTIVTEELLKAREEQKKGLERLDND